MKNRATDERSRNIVEAGKNKGKQKAEEIEQGMAGDVLEIKPHFRIDR